MTTEELVTVDLRGFAETVALEAGDLLERGVRRGDDGVRLEGVSGDPYVVGR
jgi:hypothetical protein